MCKWIYTNVIVQCKVITENYVSMNSTVMQIVYNCNTSLKMKTIENTYYKYYQKYTRRIYWYMNECNHASKSVAEYEKRMQSEPVIM